MMGFTLTASWSANVLTFYDHFYVQTGTKGFNYRPTTHSAGWGAIRYLNAFVAIGDPLLQPFNSCQHQALCPRGGESGRSIHHRVFCRTFICFARLSIIIAAMRNWAGWPQTTCDTVGLAISVNWRVESCYISLESTNAVIG